MEREKHPAELGPQPEKDIPLRDALLYDPFEDDDMENE